VKKEQAAAPPAKPANAAPAKAAAPISPKNSVAAKQQEKPPMPQRTVAVVEEKPKVSQEPVKSESAPEPVKEKVNKKKKVDNKLAKHLSAGHEDEHVNTLIHSIGHTELTHNEIQLLIEFLLNKQQDTISKDPTEWTEGKSDVMQKLKKQLQECGKQLLDEKQAAVALQNKLRELRAEMNNDKVVHAAHTKSYMEQMNQKNLDVQTLNSEIKYMNDKFATEKQQLTQQYQQLQAKLMQLNGKEHDFGQQIQQLQDTNTLLQQDLATKNKMVAEMQIFAKQNTDTMHKMGELEQKFQDYEMMLRKKDEHIGYLTQDVHTRTDELHRLNGELQRQKEEFDKVVGDLQAQEQAAVAANHDEENSKVEIRNLQNALDSAKNGCDGFKQQVDELQAQIETLKGELSQATAKRNEVNEQKVSGEGVQK
jgi:ribosome-binding protein 1